GAAAGLSYWFDGIGRAGGRSHASRVPEFPSSTCRSVPERIRVQRRPGNRAGGFVEDAWGEAMNLWSFLLHNHRQVLELTGEHLWMVGASIAIAIVIGAPAGIALTRWRHLDKPILVGATG